MTTKKASNNLKEYLARTGLTMPTNEKTAKPIIDHMNSSISPENLFMDGEALSKADSQASALRYGKDNVDYEVDLA